jgi:hypothetical protein
VGIARDWLPMRSPRRFPDQAWHDQSAWRAVADGVLDTTADGGAKT